MILNISRNSTKNRFSNISSFKMLDYFLRLITNSTSKDEAPCSLIRLLGYNPEPQGTPGDCGVGLAWAVSPLKQALGEGLQSQTDSPTLGTQ